MPLLAPLIEFQWRRASRQGLRQLLERIRAELEDADLLARGRDLSAFRAFTAYTRPSWQGSVCGRCLGVPADPRCRPHLLDDIRHGVVVELPRQQALVAEISRRTGVYAQAFRWDARGSDTVADQAALISAVGWCSGWRALLQLVEDSNATAAEASWAPPYQKGYDH